VWSLWKRRSINSNAPLRCKKLPRSSGKPRDDGVSIFYRVTFSEMLIAVTLMMAVFVGPVVAFSSRVPVPGRIGVILIGWSWLFGGNFALAWWRLPRFLRRSLQPKRASD
jgi:hypothetical protein